MLRNYSRMRKEELKTCLEKNYHYRDIAGKTASELRAMCRAHNKQFSVSTTRATKQELIDCINSQKIELTILPETLMGSRQTVDIIVANIMRDHKMSEESARLHYVQRVRATL